MDAAFLATQRGNDKNHVGAAIQKTALIAPQTAQSFWLGISFPELLRKFRHVQGNSKSRGLVDRFVVGTNRRVEDWTPNLKGLKQKAQFRVHFTDLSLISQIGLSILPKKPAPKADFARVESGLPNILARRGQRALLVNALSPKSEFGLLSNSLLTSG